MNGNEWYRKKMNHVMVMQRQTTKLNLLTPEEGHIPFIPIYSHKAGIHKTKNMSSPKK